MASHGGGGRGGGGSLRKGTNPSQGLQPHDLITLGVELQNTTLEGDTGIEPRAGAFFSLSFQCMSSMACVARGLCSRGSWPFTSFSVGLICRFSLRWPEGRTFRGPQLATTCSQGPAISSCYGTGVGTC